MSDSTTALMDAPTLGWRITVTDRADIVFAVRDYFRRLGLPAAVQGPTTIAFSTDLDAAEVEEFVESWTARNDAELSVERVDLASPPPIPLLAPPPTPRLGELLMDKGYITQEQLASALGEARTTGDLLGIVLLRDGLLYEDELARTLSQQLSIPYVSIMRIGVNDRVARLLPAAVGEAAAAIPVREKAETVQVVFADPTDPQALSAVRRYLPEIDIAVAELSDIRLAWRQLAQTAASPRLQD